jgi:hypothetical protein
MWEIKLLIKILRPDFDNGTITLYELLYETLDFFPIMWDN